jgi:hypothetical protein
MQTFMSRFYAAPELDAPSAPSDDPDLLPSAEFFPPFFALSSLEAFIASSSLMAWSAADHLAVSSLETSTFAT